MTGNIAHASNFTIDAGGDITLDADGGDVILRDAGAAYGKLTNGSGNLHIVAQGADNDIKFFGNDGGSSVTALTLDMSNAGAATFNGTISSGDIITTGIQMGSGTSNDIQADGKTAYIGSAIFGNSSAANVPATPVHIKNTGAPALRIEDLDSTNQVYDFISNYGVGLSIVDQTSSITPLAFAHTTGNATFAGSLSATTKSFDIEHPSKKGMRLHHGVVEGPEHSVYVRGKSKEKVILLPDYWVDLIHEDTITVQLTAIGSGQDLYVEDIKDNKVFVNGDNYFYYIQAERKDIDRFEVEYEG